MERIKKGNSQNVNESNDASSREMDNGAHSYQSSKFLHPNSLAVKFDVPVLLSQQNECSKCYHCKRVCTCGSYIRNRDLPSIISRNKESGLYRNGCTQRIRACEGDKIMGTKNNEEQAENKDTRKAPLLADTKSSFPPFHRKRKRATRRRKIITASTKHIPISVNENTRSSEDLSKVAESLVLQKDEGLNEKMVQSGEETRPACKVDVEKFDMLSNGIGSDSSGVISGLHSESVKERVIKYTFQRRHKRRDLSGSEVNEPPEPKVEKRVGDKKDSHGDVEPYKSS